MTKENLLIKLDVLTQSDIGFELYFLMNSGNIEKVDLDIGLSNNLQSEFVKKVCDTFNEVTSFTLRSINELSSEQLVSEYFYFDSENMYENLQFILDFAINQEEISFSLDDSKYKNINAILMKIGTHTDHIILYKHHYPINVLKKQSTINIFKEGDTFKEIIDDIFKIDINFDLILVGEHLIINKLKTLESKLGYTDVIYAKAYKNIEIINTLNFIENLDILKEAIKTNSLAKKLNKVQNSPVINIIQNDIDRVIKFIQGHPTLKQIKFNGDNKLKLDSKVSVERFLKLLDDDYLYSQLTDMLYDTNSKDTLK